VRKIAEAVGLGPTRVHQILKEADRDQITELVQSKGNAFDDRLRAFGRETYVVAPLKPGEIQILNHDLVIIESLQPSGAIAKG
jgi:hypothetical protein